MNFTKVNFKNKSGKNALENTIVRTKLFNKLIDDIELSNTTLIRIKNQIYVDKNGSDSIGNGKITNPYLTITKAIDSITDNSLINPYVINIGIGVYEEDVILKNEVFIDGESDHIFDSTDSITTIKGDLSFGNGKSGIYNLNLSGTSKKLTIAGSPTKI